MKKGMVIGIIALVIMVAVIGGAYTVSSIKHVEQGEVGVVWTAKEGVKQDV